MLHLHGGCELSPPLPIIATTKPERVARQLGKTSPRIPIAQEEGAPAVGILSSKTLPGLCGASLEREAPWRQRSFRLRRRWASIHTVVAPREDALRVVPHLVHIVCLLVIARVDEELAATCGVEAILSVANTDLVAA